MLVLVIEWRFDFLFVLYVVKLWVRLLYDNILWCGFWCCVFLIFFRYVLCVFLLCLIICCVILVIFGFMFVFYGVYIKVIGVWLIMVVMGFCVLVVFLIVLSKICFFFLFVKCKKILWLLSNVGSVNEICWWGVVVGWIVM